MRQANPGDPDYAIACAAPAKLAGGGAALFITPQNLVEFRAVATRPKANNGLGFSSAEATRAARDFEVSFGMLGETPAIYPAWCDIVESLGVLGKQVHDARLVAACRVHAVTHVLTFNTAHFARLAAGSPGLLVVHPADV